MTSTNEFGSTEQQDDVKKALQDNLTRVIDTKEQVIQLLQTSSAEASQMHRVHSSILRALPHSGIHVAISEKPGYKATISWGADKAHS